MQRLKLALERFEDLLVNTSWRDADRVRGYGRFAQYERYRRSAAWASAPSARHSPG